MSRPVVGVVERPRLEEAARWWLPEVLSDGSEEAPSD